MFDITQAPVGTYLSPKHCARGTAAVANGPAKSRWCKPITYRVRKAVAAKLVKQGVPYTAAVNEAVRLVQNASAAAAAADAGHLGGIPMHGLGGEADAAEDPPPAGGGGGWFSGW